MKLPLFGLILLSPVAAEAHHSLTAYYDEKSALTISGTVRSLQFTNLHVHILVDVVDAMTGKKVVWDMEFTSPNFFMRRGLGKDMVKRGDKVSATGFAGRGGLAKIRPTILVLADGQRIETRVTNPTQLGGDKRTDE